MNQELTLWALVVATLVQFIVGAIWYMPLFGELWGKIHGFDKKDKKTQKEMQKEMMPMLGLQLVTTFITSYALALFIGSLPEISVYEIALWMWLGFLVPTQISAVIFGGTDPRWLRAKIMVMTGASLACMLSAATVFSVMS